LYLFLFFQTQLIEVHNNGKEDVNGPAQNKSVIGPDWTNWASDGANLHTVMNPCRIVR